MSRDIKFRAWLSWYCDEEKKIVGEMALTESMIFKRDAGFLIHSDMIQRDQMSCEFTIDWQQFTGLQDKNGVDIYEGDIVVGFVHQPKKVFTVIFKGSRHCCGFVATDNEEGNPYRELWYDGFEVVGNIHEHPELLK